MASDPAPRDTKARCPKCRSRTFEVTYVDACTSTNTIRDGRWAGVFAESAMAERTAAYGNCLSCKHEWRFRNGWIA